MKRHLLAASVSMVIGAGPATAADLSTTPIYKPPIAATSPSYVWTGFYVGLDAGAAFGQASEASNLNAPACDTLPACPNLIAFLSTGQQMRAVAFTGGFEAGYNYQINHLVLGLEADLDYFALRGSFAFGPTRVAIRQPAAASGNGSLTSDWLLTVRPRAGWAYDRLLVYVTGGLAVTNESFSESITATGRPGVVTGQFNVSISDNIGWTIGGGIECALSPRWSVKAEFVHIDFGRQTVTSPVVNAPIAPPGGLTGSVMTSSLRVGTDVIRAGLNFKLN